MEEDEKGDYREMIYVVTGSTMLERDRIRKLLRDYGGDWQRIDDHTWNFEVDPIGVDPLTDLFDELGVIYKSNS